MRHNPLMWQAVTCFTKKHSHMHRHNLISFNQLVLICKISFFYELSYSIHAQVLAVIIQNKINGDATNWAYVCLRAQYSLITRWDSNVGWGYFLAVGILSVFRVGLGFDWFEELRVVWGILWLHYRDWRQEKGDKSINHSKKIRKAILLQLSPIYSSVESESMCLAMCCLLNVQMWIMCMWG